MATFDFSTTEMGLSHVGKRGLVLLENKLDFTTQAVANTDVVQALNVSAGDRVIALTMEVVTENGEASTFDVGDGVDPNGYLGAFDADTAGFTAMELLLLEAAPNTVATYTGGKLYTADDTIDLLATDANGATAAVIWIRVAVIRMG